MCMLNITYTDRKTNTWVTEKTQVTHVTEEVRRRKWTWAEAESMSAEYEITDERDMWKQHVEAFAQPTDTTAVQ